MGKQRRAVLNHPPDSVFLVRHQPFVPFLGNTRQVKVLTIESPRPVVIEFIIVGFRQSFRPILIFPNPILEFRLQQFSFFLRGHGFRIVADGNIFAVGIRLFILDFNQFAVQNSL